MLRITTPATVATVDAERGILIARILPCQYLDAIAALTCAAKQALVKRARRVATTNLTLTMPMLTLPHLTSPPSGLVELNITVPATVVTAHAARGILIVTMPRWVSMDVTTL